MARRALPLAPVFVVVSVIGWGGAGAASALYALAIVVANLWLAASLMAWGARVSPPALMAAVLGGFLVRMGLITAAVLMVKDAGWVELVPLSFTLIVGHLGLLIWETRYVSGSLAYPGLAPRPGDRAAGPR